MSQTSGPRPPAATPDDATVIPPAATALDSTHGKTTISNAVVQKVAGIAAREVTGVYNLGAGAARAFGALRERIPGSSGPSSGQGVSVEVGETQAAIDLDLVVEYGVPISELARSVRRNVIAAVERMTGLQVIEVNISVDDIHLPETEQYAETSRVQ